MAIGRSASKQVQAVLADSSPMMLTAMSEHFQRDRRFSLVSTMATAEGFLATVMRIGVDVGVIDWNLPKLGGQRLLEVLRDHPGAPRVVVYSDDPHGDVARRAMAAGAAGFCSRSGSAEQLLNTAEEVAAGKMVFPFLDIRSLATDPVNRLTKRERGMLEALANGRTNKELAREFSLSVNTVKFHLSNLYQKLDVRNRAQAIAFYYSARLDLDRRPGPEGA